jgi:hypothetical protein
MVAAARFGTLSTDIDQTIVVASDPEKRVLLRGGSET